MVTRRGLIRFLCASAAAGPLQALAQNTSSVPVVGFLNGASPGGYTAMVDAFRLGLRQTGYVEGKNVAIEYRWANGQYERLSAMADDLVRRRVAVIAATSTPANLVAKASTTVIPIVFTAGNDPVELGLVPSLSRPGGNVTGATQLTGQVTSKRIELAHQLFPKATLFGLVINPTNPSAGVIKRESEAAAKSLGLELKIEQATTESELENVFNGFSKMNAAALIIGTDAFFNSQIGKMTAWAMRNAVPAIYEYHQFVEAGGLASYGGSVIESYRLAGIYVGRILKGEKPGDLPVQQATKVELLINLKTAKALGVSVPQAVQSRADEVIE